MEGFFIVFVFRSGIKYYNGHTEERYKMNETGFNFTADM